MVFYILLLYKRFEYHKDILSLGFDTLYWFNLLMSPSFRHTGALHAASYLQKLKRNVALVSIA